MTPPHALYYSICSEERQIGRCQISNETPLIGELIYFSHTFSPDYKELWVVPLADIHFGSPLFSLHHLDHTLEIIKHNPNCYTILNGDLCDTVIQSSKGDIYHQISTPQDQRDWIIKKLTPIKDQILGCVSGNHENRIYASTGVDISKDIADALHVPYRPEGMLLKLSFGSGYDGHKDRPYSYFVYFTHGYGGARTDGAKAVKVQRVSNFIDADCFIMSHDHAVNVAPTVYLKADPRSHTDKETGWNVGKVTAYPKMLIKTQAYQKWGGYSESKGFAPVNLVAPVIKLMGNQPVKEILVVVSSG
uniref:Putative DNA repair exonuclease n=1 Tax=viral metagenome TaxID=1070528 RepID=A0A6M3LTC5_9ZZZZ